MKIQRCGAILVFYQTVVLIAAVSLACPFTAAQIRELGLESIRPSGEGWTWKFDWRAMSIPIPPVWPQPFTAHPKDSTP